MQCPFCNGDSQVSDSRATADGIRRRRICNACKRRFTTYERAASPSLKVIKRSGKSEPFSSEKLLARLQRVCRRRPITSALQLEALVRSIEAQLVDAGTKSVTSAQIAELVLRRLGELDPVSYNRLAASYLDEDGRLRTDQADERSDPDAQLGLFELDSDGE
ncbi:MAG TPA: ATP cone domain-containing protein [Kofleriaceae bacterium]|nr:ATP cone domain-containing protein [Kofleriaceae bacterium]